MHLAQIFHVVMSDYWLLTSWNLSLFPAQLQSGQTYFLPFLTVILRTLRFTHMQSLTAYFYIYLEHPKDLCLFCVTCIRPLIHDGIVQNKLWELLLKRYESRYNLCNSHNYKVPSCLCVDEWTLPTTWAAVMFLHKANRLCNPHRWLSWLSTGGREFNSGPTNTQGLTITEEKVLPLQLHQQIVRLSSHLG